MDLGNSVAASMLTATCSILALKRESHHDLDMHKSLYSLMLMPSSAIIVLHAPHVDMNAEVCLSRDRCLQAARSILDSVHALCATSFDVLLLPRPVMSMWECAVGVFSLFYCDTLIKARDDDAAMYKSEIDVFSCVLSADIFPK